jgi:hypothetical protein
VIPKSVIPKSVIAEPSGRSDAKSGVKPGVKPDALKRLDDRVCSERHGD